MTTPHKLLPYLMCVSLVAGCGHKMKPGQVAYEAGEPLSPATKLYTISAGFITSRVDVAGTLDSAEHAQISAQISANVEEIKASAGQHVARGDALARLDDRELQEQLAAAEAIKSQADAELKRAESLYEKGASTEQAMLAARTAHRAARAQWERAKVMLSHAVITAPMDGIITERRVEVGDLVEPGQVLMSIYNPARMRLEAPVPVRLVDRLKIGQSVEVDLDDPAGQLEGEIVEIVSEVDPLSRTQMVKVQLKQQGSSLLPGTFGRLSFDEGTRPGCLIPRDLVIRTGQLDSVRLVEGQRIVTRLVRTGQAQGDQIEILSGLRGGETLVAESKSSP